MKKMTIRNFGFSSFSSLKSAFLFIFLFTLVGFGSVQGQNVTIGSGTTTAYTLPVNAYWGYSYTQQIVLKSEINQSGTIYFLRFYMVGGVALSNSNDWTIYMGHTSKTSFSTTTDWVPLTGLTQVWTGTITATPPAGWYEIELDTPFAYNNTDNLVIAVDENKASYNGSSSYARTWTAPAPNNSNRSIAYYNDSTDPNPASPPTANTRYAYINQMQLDFTPVSNCKAPTQLTGTSTGPTTATLNWTASISAPANGYEWEVRTSGLPGSGAAGLAASGNVGAGVVTASVTGLTAATTYSAYVRSNCGAEFSSWAGPANFTTLCNVVSAFPYSESFDVLAFPNCWTQSYSGGITSNRWSVSASNEAGIAANEMMATYVSGTGVSRLILPVMNLTGLNNPVLKFSHYYDAYSTGITARVQSSSDGVNWVNEDFSFSSAVDVYGDVEVDITTKSATTFICFTLDGNHYNFNYWYIDDVSVSEGPSCFPPSAITLQGVTQTSANLSWTAPSPAPANGYIYELRTSGAAGSGATGLVLSGNVAGTSVSLSPLTHSTAYSFYIGSNCGAEMSAWSAPFVFSTVCLPVTVFPFNEGFEGDVFPPVCWTSLDADGDGFNWFKGLAPSSRVNSGTGAALSASYDNPTFMPLTPDNWLISPALVIPASGEFVLDYYVAAQDGNYPAEKYGVYVSTTGTNPADFTELFSEVLSTNVFQLRTVNLFDYNGQTIHFAFRHYESTDNFMMNIDDVTVRMLPPPCPPPAAQPTALELTPASNSVSGSFTASATASGYLVVQSTSATLGALPVNKTNYTVGQDLGSGTVIKVGNTTTFTSTSLDSFTKYYYFIFAYATGNDCSGPIYRTASPLTGNTTTLPAAPATFTAKGTSNSQITFTATPNANNHNILVAWNTSNTFGEPSGVLVPGQEITGGGKVHYVGSTAGLSPHNGLTQGTTYYYRAWSVAAGPVYSSAFLNTNATTYFGIPYLMDFNASTAFPAGWEGTFYIGANHGTGGSNGLYRNLWSSATSANVTSPVIMLVNEPCRLMFDYRIVNYSGYPNIATTLGPNDKLEIFYSTDNGTNYTLLHTINQANHVTSNSFANVRLDLCALNGPIKFKFLATWGEGDYYLDIDNFKVEVTPTAPIFTVNPTQFDFGEIPISVQSAPQLFTVTNAGVGNLGITSVEFIGPDVDQFVFADTNTYPKSLGEGESLVFTAQFKPTTPGLKSATIKITDNLGAKSVHNVNLSGSAFDPTITVFPFKETFETNSTTINGWSQYNQDGGGKAWAFTTTYNHTPGGSRSAYHSYGSSGYNEIGWLLSPPLAIPADADYTLSFWSYNQFPTDYDNNSVWAFPEEGDPVLLWTPVSVVASWEETVLPLTDFAGQVIQFGFRYEGTFAHSWYIDDVLINTPLIVTYDYTDLSCYQSNDGTISLNIVGGATPYSIVWTGPDGFESNEQFLTDLAAGQYFYSVTDADGISTSDNVTLTQPAEIPAPVVSNLTVTYDGQVHTIVPASIPDDTEIVWYDAPIGGNPTTAPSATNAGVYKAWVAARSISGPVNSPACESARVEVTLTLNKKGLTVTADNKEKCQFDPIPELTFTYEGFVVDEGPDNLTVVPVISTTATVNSGPGTYPITVSGGESTNYAFTYVNASLVVTQSPQVDAGPDGFVCVSESFPIVGATASNYNSIKWTTSGNGTFSNSTIINPVYNPGSLDIANGSVVLTLTGDPGSTCSQQSQMTLTLQNDLPVSVVITQLTESVCVGTEVQFKALPTNGGLNPSYQWKVNGVNAGTDSELFAYVPDDGDVVTVVLTSSIGCAVNNPAISSPFVVHVTPDLIAGVSITASELNVCDDTEVTFTATPENGGSDPSYQWLVNGENAGENSAIFTYVPLDGDLVQVVMTSNHPCAVQPVATSNTIEMEVLPPFLEVFANPVNGGTVTGTGNYTVGTTVTLVATPTPGWEFLNWKGVTGAILSTDPVYQHTVTECYEAIYATFSSTAKIAGQLKYFNSDETLIQSPNNRSVFYVQLFEGEDPIGERQLVAYNPDAGLQSYYEYIGVESGKDYKLRIWEEATDNQLGNVWTWNNWGGATSTDALIISMMTANNSMLTQLPWIAPTPTNYTPLFTKVADINNSNSLSAVDALLLQYAMTGNPAYHPLPGGAHNFQLATTKLADHNLKSYPVAPQTVFSPSGTYQPNSNAADVYYEALLTNLNDGLNVFNIYFVATGDLNVSYVPNAGSKAAQALNYQGVISVEPKDEVLIPVKVDQQVTLGAVTLGLSYDPSVIEVIGVEDYPVQYIDSEKGTARIAWFDQNGRSLNESENLLLVRARVLGELHQGQRYFELLEGVEFADVNANVINIGLYSPYIETGATGIGEMNNMTLSHSNHPNPFNESTTINYVLPEAGKVNITVYNYFGQKVKTLLEGEQLAGAQKLTLKSTDLRDAGQYFYRITLEGQLKTWNAKGSIIFVK